MAHSLPTTVDNQGNAHRLGLACAALVALVIQDARVKDRYAAWRRRLETHLLLTRNPRAPYVDDKLGIWLASLGLDFPWLPQAVHEAWMRQLQADVLHGGAGRIRIDGLALPGVQNLPKGKRARHVGEDIARNVQWWYRARIQRPTVDISDIARDYASRAKRHTDARSVVQNGIKQAETLLDLTRHKK